MNSLLWLLNRRDSACCCSSCFESGIIFSFLNEGKIPLARLCHAPLIKADAGALYYDINTESLFQVLLGRGFILCLNRTPVLQTTCYNSSPFEERALYSSPVFSFPLNIQWYFHSISQLTCIF